MRIAAATAATIADTVATIVIAKAVAANDARRLDAAAAVMPMPAATAAKQIAASAAAMFIAATRLAAATAAMQLAALRTNAGMAPASLADAGASHTYKRECNYHELKPRKHGCGCCAQAHAKVTAASACCRGRWHNRDWHDTPDASCWTASLLGKAKCRLGKMQATRKCEERAIKCWKSL